MTGQTQSPQTVNQVAEALAREYGAPDLGNLPDPLDELVFIIVSTMTTNRVHTRTFKAIKRRFPTWKSVLSEPVEELIKILRPAGLSDQKGRRIYQILERIAAENPEVSLDHLRNLEQAAAERYLLNLPGVGKKVARCVMIYSLGMDAFPVDAHVLRVCRRLGWIPAKMSWVKAHDALQRLVPPGYGHDLHVNMVVHGRQVCTATSPPACTNCVIRLHCRYFEIKHRGRLSENYD